MSEEFSKQAIETSQRFLGILHEQGYDFFTGVPCSLLGGLFQELERNKAYDYVPAVREDAAVGLAAGAYMAGRKPVVLMQNSGLGVCYNALASLNEIYEIPTLMIVSWRGQGGKDAPEHIRMGMVMTKILDELELAWKIADISKLTDQLQDLTRTMDTKKRPAALVAPKGIFA